MPVVENKINPKFTALIFLAVFLLTVGFGCSKKPDEPTSNTNQNTNANTPGRLNQLPDSGGNIDIIENGFNIIGKQLEQIFFADFYKPTPLSLFAQAPGYTLPISIKTDVQNYRDISRKINLDPVLEPLANNGFTVLTEAQDFQSTSYQKAYLSLRGLEVPALVTSDAVGFNYRLALHYAYKQIERDAFFDNTWDVLRSLYTKAKNRYELLLNDQTRSNDLLLEGNRLEMAFAATALKLLQPQDFQIDENTSSITPDSKSFTPQDRLRYDIQLPDYLERQVNDELELIKTRPRGAQKSPVFLYASDYSIYEIPPEYQTSEKLKNFWLAARYLSDKTFLINYQSEDCPECLLDEEDSKIHMVAASLIAQDFTDDQLLKNAWLRVYKTIAFFKGLEQELSYLEFADVLAQEFGEDFFAEELFKDFEQGSKNIQQLRQSLNNISFLRIEGGQRASNETRGMKLLRDTFTPNDYLFSQLSYPNVGNLINEVPLSQRHFTTCQLQNQLARCSASGLDITNVLGADGVKSILNNEGSSNYQNYDSQISALQGEISKFDEQTWHKNIFWSTLFANQNLTKNFVEGYPTFMQQPLWRNKSLNTALGTWLFVGSEPIIETQAVETQNTTPLTVPDVVTAQTGYIEPSINYYNQLLANTNMLIDGLVLLKIVNDNSPAIKTLTNLSDHLKQVTEISLKELSGQELEWQDYKFINEYDLEFNRAIGSLTDSSFNVLQREEMHRVVSEEGTFLGSLISQVDKVNLLIVVYTDHTGKRYLAAGPIFSYRENRTNTPAGYGPWQEAFIATP